MIRAAVGSWVLVLLFSALLVSSGLWGAPATGSPARQPPPTPPAAGTCVDSFRDPQPVPCDRDHVGEIVEAWTGRFPAELDDPPGSAGIPPAEDTQGRCWGQAEKFVGSPGPVTYSSDITWHWSSASWQTRIVHGPAQEFVDDWSWSACVVDATNMYGGPLALTGSVRGLGLDPTAELPQGWRTCVRDDLNWPEWLPCSDPHRSEFVASGQITLPEAEIQRLAAAQRISTDPREAFGDAQPVYDQPAALDYEHPTAAGECGRLIESYLGAPLTAHDGELRAVVTYPALVYAVSTEAPSEEGTFDGGVTADSGFYGSARPAGVLAECRVAVVGDRTLVGSVAGVGSGPLPLG